jgi:hypothetical protein
LARSVPLAIHSREMAVEVIDETINSLIIDIEVATKDLSCGEHHLAGSNFLDIVRIDSLSVVIWGGKWVVLVCLRFEMGAEVGVQIVGVEVVAVVEQGSPP